MNAQDIELNNSTEMEDLQLYRDTTSTNVSLCFFLSFADSHHSCSPPRLVHQLGSVRSRHTELQRKRHFHAEEAPGES